MILVGGENLVDLIEGPDGRFTATPGGGPFNVARALGRLGESVGYLTPVSTDAMGARLASVLEDAGVRLCAPRSPSPSSLALVSTERGQPRYQFYRRKTAERRVSTTLLNRIIPNDARALYLGSLALTSGRDADAWAQIYQARHRRGLFTALDPNIRPAFINKRRKYLARLERILPETDLLKLSDEDITWLKPEMEPDAAAKAMASRYRIPLLVLTKGAAGVSAYGAGGRIDRPAHKATPFVDAIGAGDTFMAALLAELNRAGLLGRTALTKLPQDSLHPALTIAAKAAALSCQHQGCTPPDRATLEQS